MIFCPLESISARIRISSWADSKPFGTKGNFRSWHCSGYSWSVLSCGREIVSGICAENEKSRVAWEGERGYHAQVSCPVVHIFSVKQHVFWHIWACAFSLITRPEKLFWQMWPWMCVYVCVCKTLSWGYTRSPVSVLFWLLPYSHSPHQPRKTNELHLISLIFRSFRKAFWEA